MNELHPDLARVIIPADKIQTRVKEMAEQICQDFAGGENLYLIGILKGAFIFLADLTRHLKVPHVVDSWPSQAMGRPPLLVQYAS